ncbi:alpha/beta fold hydrolase [Shewanella sp. VB17]|nr:alpha/beta fold hydrolase [Shewanella sp. VB17]
MSETVVIFTHGAGANMRSCFMERMAKGLSQSNIGVVRFNLPYMRANEIDGKRRPPDRAPKLLKDFNLHIEAIKDKFAPKRLFLMGKSMGGRMAAMVAEKTSVDGVICLGYPFIPLKGGDPRLAPIELSQAPLCVIQGERDKFGGRELVESWPIMHQTQLYWLVDGDHSFVPRKSSGMTEDMNLGIAISCCIDFIQGQKNA